MIEFVRELNRSYLKITQGAEAAEGYSMRMVENNMIDGLLPVRREIVNNNVSYLYDISGRLPLEEKYIKKEFSAEDIAVVAGFIKEIVCTTERYMLDVNGVLFDIKYIFCGINDSTWSFVYNSGLSSDAREGIKKIFEYILSRLDHRDSNAVILGYGLYKRVCRDEINLQRVFDNLDEFADKDKAEPERLGGGQNTAEYDGEPTLQYGQNIRTYSGVAPETVNEEKEKKLPDKKYILTWAAVTVGASVLAGLVLGLTAAFAACAACVAAALVCFAIKLKGPSWEKIVTSEVRLPYEVETPEIIVHRESEPEGATVVISSEQRVCLRRVSSSGQAGEEYVLMEDVGIGSGAAADVIIKDSGISRLHAKISREGNMYFIKDMNSTNGTWVNGHRLSVYELCPLKNGDMIKLAGSSFELIDTSSQ